MVACMLKTYRKPMSTYKQSNTADALNAVAGKLSDKPNTGSRRILRDMKKAKKHVIAIYVFFYSEAEFVEWYPLYYPFVSENRSSTVLHTLAETATRLLAPK